ncbi:DUF1579 family protein [Mucilaginibacter agri]|uniref:DUF1579 domain-containing protein n=1 Tax=Mucilaginibacter agri TaxID=2695265 RepID=A0A965ZLJ7_9SPHI|nr:DUF1579 family protein [Mucilaginibacter agri]NCD71926.1 DUF1579 domain-containing protein [Mucilaginibacter agri]
MKNKKTKYSIFFKTAILITAVVFTVRIDAFAQNDAKQPDPMEQMLSLSAPGANHLLLAQLVGNWNFQDAKLAFVKGTLTRKAIYSGRFFLVELTGGKLSVPVANGQMKEDNYQSMQIEGYDNPRKKFVMTSINNHIGSDIQEQTGDYNPDKKQFTFIWDDLLTPGALVNNKRVLTVIDQDHYKEEYFEINNGKDIKVRELDYNRIK